MYKIVQSENRRFTLSLLANSLETRKLYPMIESTERPLPPLQHTHKWRKYILRKEGDDCTCNTTEMFSFGPNPTIAKKSLVLFYLFALCIKPLYGRGRGECWLEIAHTIGLNCGVTHSPGKIEYNCRYFILSFRKQIGEHKFGKNSFHTLQSTMSHRPLTNSSSLKITAA